MSKQEVKIPILGKYLPESKAMAEFDRVIKKLEEMYPYLKVTSFCPGFRCVRKGDTHYHESMLIPDWAAYAMIGEPQEIQPPAPSYEEIIEKSAAKWSHASKEMWKETVNERLKRIGKGGKAQPQAILYLGPPEDAAPRD